jgi:hypothetical protein
MSGDVTSPSAHSSCRGSGGMGVRFRRRCGRVESPASAADGSGEAGFLRAATEASPEAEVRRRACSTV